MGLCQLILALANATATAKAPLPVRHRLLIEILRLMPLYAEAIRNLTSWENAYQNAHPNWPDESEVGELLDKVSSSRVTTCTRLSIPPRPMNNTSRYRRS